MTRWGAGSLNVQPTQCAADSTGCVDDKVSNDDLFTVGHFDATYLTLFNMKISNHRFVARGNVCYRFDSGAQATLKQTSGLYVCARKICRRWHRFGLEAHDVV